MANIPLESSGAIQHPSPENSLEASEVLDWLGSLSTYNGVLQIFNGDFSPEGFVHQAQSSGDYEVVASADGVIGIVQGEAETGDRSMRSDYFDYHTDGFYLPEPPALFLLSCDNPGTQDAKTAFANTKEALHKIEDYLPVLEQLRFVYIGKTLLRHSRPLIERHPLDGTPITNLVTRGFVEPIVSQDTIDQLPDYRFINEAMHALYEAIEDSVEYAHSWKAGDTIVCDNHTFVHARLADTPDPTRRLYRIWLNLANSTTAR